MSALVLWKRLTENDFNAMQGEASPHGHGGGARHIALGVNRNSFPIAAFLGRKTGNVRLRTVAREGHHGAGNLLFRSNPNRRNGEWLIRDQFSNRHPALAEEVGFPATYDETDPPYVLVFRIGGVTHVRSLFDSELRALPPNALPVGILDHDKGIQVASKAFLVLLGIQYDTPLESYDVEQDDLESAAFDPNSTEDGRERIIAAIVRRQGQRDFRRKLLSAYDTRCAITRCRIVWVLEAAHISPYRGVRTNVVSNGLLLRADVHTLFDLALISIAPDSLKICVSPHLEDDSYRELDGKRIIVLPQQQFRPNTEAIQNHYSQFERQRDI